MPSWANHTNSSENFNPLEERTHVPHVYRLPLCISAVFSEWNKEDFLCIQTWSAVLLACREDEPSSCFSVSSVQHRPSPFPVLFQPAVFSFKGQTSSKSYFHSFHSLSFISSTSVTYSVLGPGSRYKTEQNKHGPFLFSHMEGFGL